jgi:hypothetical protein
LVKNYKSCLRKYISLKSCVIPSLGPSTGKIESIIKNSYALLIASSSNMDVGKYASYLCEGVTYLAPASRCVGEHALSEMFLTMLR